jgi:hypothetical protein
MPAQGGAHGREEGGPLPAESLDAMLEAFEREQNGSPHCHTCVLRAAKFHLHLRTYGHPTEKRPKTAPNRARHCAPHTI